MAVAAATLNQGPDLDVADARHFAEPAPKQRRFERADVEVVQVPTRS